MSIDDMIKTPTIAVYPKKLQAPSSSVASIIPMLHIMKKTIPSTKL